MLRKIAKNSSKRSLLLYAVIWGSCSILHAQEPPVIVEDVVLAEEKELSLLKDPFDPLVQAPGLIELLGQGVDALKAAQSKLPEAPVVVEVDPLPQAATEVAAAVQIPSLIVTGIVFNTKDPQAIINGQVVGVGDTIDGIKITKIGRGRIDVQFQGIDSMVQFNNE